VLKLVGIIYHSQQNWKGYVETMRQIPWKDYKLLF